MHNLVYNEMLKLVRKKRILVITLILLILIPIFTYAQYHTTQNAIKQLGTSDWRAILQQQIIDQQNRLASSRVPEEWKESIKLNIQQQQYYLDNNINPTAPGAPTFIREFVEEAVSLFLPLLVVILAADIVSSEHSGGTIKLLLTRPVRRWKVLLSKYLALLLSVSFMVVLTAVIGYLVSGMIFGYKGWTLPVLTGFQVQGEHLITDHVHLIPQWKYILMAYGLAWFSCLAVGTVSFMVSVLVRSTASSMGIMLAAVISGSLLGQLAPNWNALKYLAFTNLRLTDYLEGEPILVEGMNLPFSLTVLTVWSITSLIVAFGVFTRRDVLA
ncbi:ABC transporter permease [Lihuaxuella thermophila]|uniref:ABC-2 type transport system permease protein n=1 Tax=Lihuaxuella thermophila TaxID=1173111 RepID=A0A1H8FT39_9BACL|nr:ABC transporter permease [Lihuaxuella thermophila]SEN34809.1 ABC-2 type transport system permease protein [Lihuaxuella thermophila]